MKTLLLIKTFRCTRSDAAKYKGAKCSFKDSGHYRSSGCPSLRYNHPIYGSFPKLGVPFFVGLYDEDYTVWVYICVLLFRETTVCSSWHIEPTTTSHGSSVS